MASSMHGATCVSCPQCECEIKIPSFYEKYRESIKAAATRWYHNHKHEESFKEGARRRAREYYYRKKERLANEAKAKEEASTSQLVD